jgi:hypothetical protein
MVRTPRSSGIEQLLKVCSVDLSLVNRGRSECTVGRDGARTVETLGHGPRVEQRDERGGGARGDRPGRAVGVTTGYVIEAAGIARSTDTDHLVREFVPPAG